MKRVAVLVANDVFDKGVAGLENAVANTDGKKQTWVLDVGPTIMQVGYDGPGKAVCLNWWGNTNYSNIVWTKFVFFNLSLHPVKSVECFTEKTC